MRKLEKASLTLIILTLTLASISRVNTQTTNENMKQFLNSKVPGIQLLVNATAETQPGQNISVMLVLEPQSSVYVEFFNFSIHGFLDGTGKTMMTNITRSNFHLNDTSKAYSRNFTVPEHVWDTTYGEIALTYRADMGGLEVRIPQIGIGFTMTHVENVYFEAIEQRLEDLNQTFQQSFQMNLTDDNLANLNKTYWALQGTSDELNNTRGVVAVLAITTAFFLITTVYMILRKPKQPW